ncbi:MAG: acyl-CoA dehydrogenase [Lysobacteraceae bacterium]|nr:MAG: acyl-CoA dehydrogenase [Xanthomonadaceae bacterium]
MNIDDAPATGFIQPGPTLANTFDDDRALRSHLRRVLPGELLAVAGTDYAALGEHAAKAWESARSRTPEAPRLVQWDAWGTRVDRIETTRAWQHGPVLAARFGLVATGHEAAHGAHARVDQFARVYLHHVASEFFTCPLAMSDGAVAALKASGNAALCARVLPRLLSRDPDRLWISGQWMTETAGGSDVGRTATVARRDAQGRWRLHGRKWFTSAVIGEMALALARREGAGDGADALALFLVETRDAEGCWNGIRVDRLKDKLGTRELPTAEIHLEGSLAEPVGDLAHGVRQVAPMLNVTRTWNAVCALATMRRCLALTLAHARRREAFGHALARLPLHRATLAALQAEFEAAFGLVFFVVELLGRVEHGGGDADQALLRALTPLAKLWTAKLAVRIASETCEAFGGAGYIEDTGIPLLLRDAQVYPIWEGTTNVLALDALRALRGDRIRHVLHAADALLVEAGGDAHGIAAALGAARDQLDSLEHSRDELESVARGIALTLARGFAAALLARHARWTREQQGNAQTGAALSLFAAHGISRLRAPAMDAVAMLVDNGAP